MSDKGKARSGKEGGEGAAFERTPRQLIKGARRLAKRYRVQNGKGFRLDDVDPGDTAWLKSEDKPAAKEALQLGVELLAELQDMLYAQDRWAVLLIFQAMDAAGKDGAIKHVMSGVNPQGCQVFSFKAPVGRGARSRLPVALHEEPARARPHRHLQPLLLRGGAGRARAPGAAREAEAAAGARHEEHLEASASTTSAPSSATSPATASSIRKFFLHVSRKEQKRRFLERIDEPREELEVLAADAQEREHWDDYMAAYEDMIRNTATEARAVVRRARRQQVVHPDRRRVGRHRRAGFARPALSEGR